MGEREEFKVSSFEPSVLHMFQNGTRSGTEPGVVDLALFGILRNMITLPETKQLFEKNQHIRDWYSAIDKTMNAPYGPNVPRKEEVEYEIEYVDA